LRAFQAVKTRGGSREKVYKQALALRDAWETNDPNWVPLPNKSLRVFTDLLEACKQCELEYSARQSGWRNAAAALNTRAAALDADNVTWYVEATTRYSAGMQYGDLIRSDIPTTSSPAVAVGQAVIMHLTGVDGIIHFDCAAANATPYTYFHQPPEATDFVVLLANTAETSVTLHAQPAGLHRFKAFGSNAQGQGPESEVAELNLSGEPAARAPAPNGNGESEPVRGLAPAKSTAVNV
jgi:hypothetical protein